MINKVFYRKPLHFFTFNKLHKHINCNIQLANQKAIKNHHHKKIGTIIVTTATSGDSDDKSKPNYKDPLSMDLNEVNNLDKLIDLLLSCNSKEKLLKSVGENILAINERFWLRLASRADASSGENKNKLISLSRTVMTLVDGLVQLADEKLSDSGKILGEILKSAADANGNWNLPLSESEIASLKKALEENKEHINETFLSNAFAWMRKSSDDGLNGMVYIIQRVLQLYAAGEQRGSETEGIKGIINNLIATDPEMWQTSITEYYKNKKIREEEFMNAIQEKLETTINLPEGSYAQRVQVEFLNELKNQGKAIFEKLT